MRGIALLSPAQLQTLTSAWAAWLDEASLSGRFVGRARLHLVFTLIRYGGLRPMEALNFRPGQIDPGNGQLTIPGSRHLYLPFVALRSLRRILTLPEAHDPGFLAIDPGFLRKTFSAIAQNCGLEPQKASPRALRYARGLELLSLHMPLNVVKTSLDLRKNEQLAMLSQFHAILEPDAPGKPNLFYGQVTAMETGHQAVRATLETDRGLSVTAILPTSTVLDLEIRTGESVRFLIVPELVTLSADPHPCANLWPARVEHVSPDPVENIYRLAMENDAELHACRDSGLTQFGPGAKVFAGVPGRAIKIANSQA